MKINFNENILQKRQFFLHFIRNCACILQSWSKLCLFLCDLCFYLAQVKSRRTKEDLKDKEIEILKLKYKTGIIDSMDFLMAVSSFVKDFE